LKESLNGINRTRRCEGVTINIDSNGDGKIDEVQVNGEVLDSKNYIVYTKKQLEF